MITGAHKDAENEASSCDDTPHSDPGNLENNCFRENYNVFQIAAREHRVCLVSLLPPPDERLGHDPRDEPSCAASAAKATAIPT